jgi:D-beta-D-heptose 7-phosphate kinase/D-beta-D-heptose 1-phosphate adenosyltransferase
MHHHAKLTKPSYNNPMKPNPKIKNLSEMPAIVRQAKRAGKKIVTTNGAFDILHIGHVRNLQVAKSAGDILIVGVNSDKSVRTHKDKSRPVVPQKERAEIIAALEAVDYVFIFDTPTALPWIAELKPHVHAKGADRALKQMLEPPVLKKYGGKILRIPYVKSHSTTGIIERIKQLP